ncbi:hypothetical protein [Nocardia brasiliensis]|uniref:hypothetical protein n=1 Tax=Nocardia brasiliensis TaxID=37326 RepID=UPI00245740E9|nr:hypothetical protein [Nocardia brasiliensis]
MLLDTEADICLYVAKDTVHHRRLLSEAMRDFRTSGLPIAPHRLRVFWIPADFDADDDEQRRIIGDVLTEVPEMATGRLIGTIAAAVERWGIDFETIEHVVAQHGVKLPAWWPDNPAEQPFSR